MAGHKKERTRMIFLVRSFNDGSEEMSLMAIGNLKSRRLSRRRLGRKSALIIMPTKMHEGQWSYFMAVWDLWISTSAGPRGARFSCSWKIVSHMGERSSCRNCKILESSSCPQARLARYSHLMQAFLRGYRKSVGVG